MNTVKLLVCYHKPSYLFQDEILTPIHVGRALAKKKSAPDSPQYQWLMEHLIGDDTGENISEKNGSYNELTALYWAWKNYDRLGNPDYIGLMHYRRHFVLYPGEFDVIPFEDMEDGTFDEAAYYREINYSPEKLRALVEGCDFVAHIGRVNNVYRHYLENHRGEDLDMVFNLLYQRCPEYKKIAKEYLAGDLSNFCNMVIFRRELFFAYCEWIFPLLEEFERRVGADTRRFFVSERLTGVYLAKLMKDKRLKYKVVPISFLSEWVTVPLILPYKKEAEFCTAVTILSLVKNKDKRSRYTICLLCGFCIDRETKRKFEGLVSGCDGINLQFVEAQAEPECFPAVLAEIFPQWKKCIYLTEDVLVLKDLTEFYRTCSTDDYEVVGAPLETYDIYEQDKKLQGSFLVINLEGLRRAGLSGKAVRGQNTFHELYRGRMGYVPWYYLTVAGSLSDGKRLFPERKSRGQLQAEAAWKPVLLYDGENNKPWRNPQDLFSLFWWEMSSKVPVSFRFPEMEAASLEAVFSCQQQEINEIGTMLQKQRSRRASGAAEDWRNYSMAWKLWFYYKNNGFGSTVKYCWKKYIIKNNR